MTGQVIKWVSSLLVFTLFITYMPFNQLSTVFAESNTKEAVPEKVMESSSSIVKKEIPSMRTEKSKTFLNPDGTYTSEISQTPIHFKNKSKQWEPINNQLISDSKEKVYENKANAFSVKFNETQDTNSPIMQIDDQQYSTGLQLEPLEHTGEEPANVEGIVKDDSIIYPNIYSNIDLKYSVGSDRIKEDIIYSEKPEEGFPSEFTYKMDLEGMKVVEDGGILYLNDTKTNEPLYYFEAPYMYDSYVPEGFKATEGIKSIPEEAMSYHVKISHEVIDNQLYLHLAPSKEWLEDANRIYPITIDPTIVRIQSATSVEDTNVRSSFPTQTGGNDIEIGGGASNDNVFRSLLKFDLSSIPAATNILSSSLNLSFSSTNNQSPVNIGLYKMSRDWNENQASWNYAKTSPSTAWTSKGGDYVASNKLSTVSGLTSPVSLEKDMKKWEVPIHIIQNWRDTPSTNYGFLLKSESENTNIYKKFISSEHSADEKYKPLLTVTYRTNARLGLEDYWDYTTHELIGGSSYTNLMTGNNVIQYNDLSLVGRGGSGLAFTRTYNSKSRESSGFGYGWMFTGNEKLFLNIKETANILNYQDADGTDHEFSYDSKTATYYASAGRYETIKKTASDEYTMYEPNGVQTIFKIKDAQQDTNVKIAYITTQTDLNHNKVNYIYNEKNQLIKISTDLGESLSKVLDITYNTQGFIDTIKYDGRQFSYRYSNGYLEYVDELKNNTGTKTTTQFIYKNTLIDTIIDPNGRKTNYTYIDENLAKVQEPQIDKATDDVSRPGTEYKVDIPNKQSIVTDPEGNLTTYVANNNYVIIKSIDSLGIVTDYKLDTNFNVLSITETENGVTTVVSTNTYENGNLLTSIDAEGNKEINKYTTYGNLETHTDANGKVSTYEYDPNGNLLKSIIPHNDGYLTTDFANDSYGDVKSLHSSDGITEEYDVNYTDGIKTTKHTDSNGITTAHTTDLSGNVLSQTDGKGQVTSFHYNLKNELDIVTDAKNKKTNYQYDNNGNLRFIRNAQNANTEFQYNGQNLIEKEINDLGQTTSYLYNNNGNLTDISKPSGDTIHTEYDDESRIKAISVGEKTLWKYVYENEKVSILSENNATLRTLEYYDNGLLKSINYHDSNGEIGFNYLGDQYVSNISHSSYSNQYTNLEFIPDESYKTKEIKRNGSSIVSLGYDKTGLPALTTFNNESKYSKEYINGRLDTEKLYSSPTTIYDSFTYEHDNNNNIKSIITNQGAISYEYDELNQLKKETLLDGTEIAYDYDDVGNRISKKVTKNGQTIITESKYNSVNQLEEVGQRSYNYDKNGNLKTDGVYIYSYNELDQLIKVQDLTGKIIAEYGYNEEGNRDFSKDSRGTTFYQYNGNQVLYETDVRNQVIKEYTYDDNGTPLTMNYKGSMYYYLTNYRGDVLALTDKDGKVVASYTYDAWGNILSQSGALASVNPYRYAGYRYDEDTKMYYLMARYYNPENGVFISLDPVRGDIYNPITLNGYNYANNNPVMNVDPDGNWAIVAFFVGGAINALPMLISFWLKKGNIKGFNWGRFALSFIVGGFAAMGGQGLYLFLKANKTRFLFRMIVMINYEAKAYIFKQLAKGKRPTISGLVSALSGIKSAYGFSIGRLIKSYKQNGVRGVKALLKRLAI
ncbi:DNRLRE domain-containing protein [Fredinandcohnia quinoae]|uniref:DNRLRE domain-containing protein n=1 Tax=Fredinandcohnia quinoae TaxID=2918902 RepID=A0AAW5EE50_9BACI|nr:DNRLRE domain-containing protein [Fredinandcohnia sp. SECRCQ15]MCH1627039.1 DNRLRE domain-containing protein [Fredinandcohnia sp. SECRCQ15]